MIRHGQTAWNIEGRQQGQKDSPLTWEGIKQAKKVSEIIKNLKASNFKIYASPLGRVKQFAYLCLANTNLSYKSIIFNPNLREHSFGDWEGLTIAEIEKNFPGELKKREQNKWNYKVPNGESYSLVKDRLEIFLKNHEMEDMILFTHETASKVIRGILLDLSEGEILSLKHKQNIIYKIENSDLKSKKCHTINF